MDTIAHWTLSTEATRTYIARYEHLIRCAEEMRDTAETEGLRRLHQEDIDSYRRCIAHAEAHLPKEGADHA